MNEPSLLRVSDQAWGEVRPRAATVHVTLTGSKLFSGRAALTKSEELRKLAEAVQARGVAADAIALAGASLDVSTGLFSRSSSVMYRVQIQLADLELIAPVLEAIAEAKQARLSHIAWDYPGAASEALLAECAVRAAARAKRLAAALGVELGPVHEVREEELGDEAPQPVVLPDLVGVRLSKGTPSIATELAGIELAPPKRVGVRVSIAYRVPG